MKRYSFILSFMFCTLFGFSQSAVESYLDIGFSNISQGPSPEVIRKNFRYEIYHLNTRAHASSKEKLSQAKMMTDLIKEYPSSWIKKYISTEVVAVCSGKEEKAIGSNATLTTAQRSILAKADFNTKVLIHVKYQQENAATRKIEEHNLNYAIAVVPKTQATYFGGQEAVNTYLKKNAIDKISDRELIAIKKGRIHFSIDKNGAIKAVELATTTGSTKIDALFLQVIREMPLWKPAKDAKGILVKQRFELAINNFNDGC